jgi:HSP20 family molecular chaperone IbpA
MWAQACELLGRAERLQAHFFEVGRPEAGRPTWEAPIDVFESGDELSIVVALPGVAPDAVEVTLDGESLVVNGRRPWPAEAAGARIHRLEIPWGRFVRRIPLPADRLPVVRKPLADGSLTLVLRRRGEPR